MWSYLEIERYEPTHPIADQVAIVSHGFPGNYTKNEDLAFALSALAQIDTYVIKYKGVGSRIGEFSFKGVMKDISEFMSQFEKTTRFTMVAHSWGGTASLQGVLDHSQQIQQIFYLAPMLEWPKQSYIISIIKDLARWQGQLKGFFPNVESLIAESEQLYESQPDRLQKLAKLNVPITVFHGTRDTVLEISLSEKFVQSCRSAELITSEEGHYLEDRPRLRTLILKEVLDLRYKDQPK